MFLYGLLQGVDVPVFVIAGKWECSQQGKWEFVIENDRFARSICVTSDMTFSEVEAAVAHEFDVDASQWSTNLSYWLPEQLSIFSTSKRPPVALNSNGAVKSFLRVKETEAHLNLCLSIESRVGGDILKNDGRALGECSGTAKYIPREQESDRVESQVVKFVTAPTTETNGDLDEGTGKYLQNEVEGVHVESAVVKSVSVPTTDPIVDAGDAAGEWLVRVNRRHGKSLWTEPDSDACDDFDMAGIISLADAGTPSLSSDIDGRCEEDIFANYSEDEAVLREIEALERATAEKARVKGKGKMPLTDVDFPGSEDGAFQSERLDGYTSGYNVLDDSLSVDDDVEDSQFWADVYERANPEFDVSGGRDEVLGTPEPDIQVADSDVIPEETGGQSGGVGEDISAAVLAYRPIPMQLDNIYDDDEIGTCPTTDADPCFDYELNLTTTEVAAAVSSSEDAIYRGRVFRDKLHMQTTLAIYAIRRLFHFIQTRSDKKRLICVCVDRGYAWRVYGHVVANGSKNFEVRTATLTHTCSVTSRAQYGKQATAKVIAEVLKGKYSNGAGGPRAMDVPDIVLSELKVYVTYMKAWYAREAAMIKSRGSEENSYKLLAVYMHLLEQGNPGTVYKLHHIQKASGVQQFKYLFFALGASILGIKHMRKVILVDGTAIKARFKGVLLAASMQDANFQVYPIAFGIVDAENEPAWTWFFQQLSQIVPDAEDLVLVTDKHRSIYAAVGQIYPKAFHGCCVVHLERNVKVRWARYGIPGLVRKAARAFNVGQFKAHYNEIRARSESCFQYLEAIPKEHWTQAYCPAKRYNIMSSNIAEALNAALAKILELPLVTMVDGIRGKLMRWFCLRRAKVATLKDPLTPNANKMLLDHNVHSTGLAVIQVSQWSYQVDVSDDLSYYVDLEAKTCTCLQFQKLLMPCCHALAAARINNVHIPTLVGIEYRSELFAKQYEAVIYPVPNQADEEVPASVEETQLVPPDVKRGPGRRRTRRIPSAGENFVVSIGWTFELV